MDRSFFKKLNKARNIDKDFYEGIKDLEQSEQFDYLMNYIKNLDYNFENNQQIKTVFDLISKFFINRSKWKNLRKAKDIIIKLNLDYKEIEYMHKDSKKTSEIGYVDNINETDDIKVISKY